MKKILIIDDSALMRKALSDIIESDRRFQVGDFARNGVEALELLMRKKYDAVLLDINMPQMDGIELLEELQRRQMKETVIVASTMAVSGAKVTIKALELGAFDFITKPERFSDFHNSGYRERFINILLSATVGNQKRSDGRELKRHRESMSAPAPVHGKKLIALACSTGGPRALQSVVPLLSGNLNVPMLIVQHMPVGFTNSLAIRLDELSPLHVKEAEDGETIKKGNVYIAKGGSQMRYERQDRISIKTGEVRNGLKPCADIMYESLCQSDYDEIICVVLTGMGGDGTKGIETLSKSHNVYVIAQDEETSTVYGMPRMVYEAGLVNEVVPLNAIADAIMKKAGVRKDGC